MAELSIIIPARNEPYLQKTVEDLLTKIKGDTEILVGLDAPDKVIFNLVMPKVKCVLRENYGQRALQNELAKMSEAKYILKTDAHVMFSKGFDMEMMKVMEDNMIQAPVMLPLDAERWQVPANLPVSWFGFDPDLITQIDKSRQTDKLIDESMCLHGSAWMISRENYWKWNICDESLGSWGKQGTEIGIKAFLNGGKCVVNKNCFYAHLERKLNGDFPYERDMEAIKKTRDEANRKLRNKSIAPLIEKWGYPCGWTKELVDNLPNA